MLLGMKRPGCINVLGAPDCRSLHTIYTWVGREKTRRSAAVPALENRSDYVQEEGS